MMEFCLVGHLLLAAVQNQAPQQVQEQVGELCYFFRRDDGEFSGRRRQLCGLDARQRIFRGYTLEKQHIRFVHQKGSGQDGPQQRGPVNQREYQMIETGMAGEKRCV